MPRCRHASGNDSSEARLAYTLGHAVFDFIEATHGKAAVTQFLLELRRNVVDRTGDLYQAAFYQTPEEFDAGVRAVSEGPLRGQPGVSRRGRPTGSPPCLSWRRFRG